MKNMLLFAALCFGFSLTPAFSLGISEEYQSDDWDTDRNGAVDDREWYEGMDGTEYYDDWDTNSDDYLDADEFTLGAEGTGFFDTWDFDEDGYLDLEEFGESFWQDRFFGVWDVNDDDLLDEGELYEGLYDRWDTTFGGLSREEFYDGWYDSWYFDDEGYLGEEEELYGNGERELED